MAKPKTRKHSGRKRVPRPERIDPGQRYTLPETDAALGQSHVKTYQQIKSGELKSIVDGRRRYVPGAEIIRVSSPRD
jgi:hypothetical protein